MLRTTLTAFALCATMLAPALAQEADPYADMVISEDLDKLPDAVRQTREKLIEAARSGDIEQLALIYAGQEYPPQVSFGLSEDPIAYLRESSEDGEGLTILAILLDLLDAPYAVLGASSEDPTYVWPYLSQLPDLTALTPDQKVDAYRLISTKGLQEQIEFGGWFSWRTLIAADGEWLAFIAGD